MKDTRLLLASVALAASMAGHSQSPPAQTGAETHSEQGDQRPRSGQSHGDGDPNSLSTPPVSDHAVGNVQRNTAAPQLKSERLITISVGNSAEGEKGADVEQKSEKQRASGWGVLEWSALATGGFTGVLAIFTFFLWRETRNTSQIAKAAMQAGRDQSRAYLFGKEVQMIYDAIYDGPNKLLIVITNYGATPATLRSPIVWSVAGLKQASIETQGPSDFASWIIGAGESIKLQATLHLGTGLGTNIHEGAQPLTIACFFSYTDFTGTLHKRSASFAFLAEPYGFHLVHGAET